MKDLNNVKTLLPNAIFSLIKQSNNFAPPHLLVDLILLLESIVKYSINTYVRYLSYALLVIAELPNDELTGNHTLSLPPLCLWLLMSSPLYFPSCHNRQ